MSPTAPAVPRPHPPIRPFPARYVPRWQPIERAGHWWTVFWFAMTAVSGLTLGDEGGSSARLAWHIASAAALVGGLLALPLLPGRRALLATLRDLRPDATDAAALRAPATLVPGRYRPGTPRWGRFNTGQKVATLVLAVLFVGIYASGLASWASGADEGGPHGAFVLAAAVVLGGHVFLALVLPATRPALRGMLTGEVDRAWAEHHHPAWVAEVDRRGREDRPSSPPPTA